MKTEMDEESILDYPVKGDRDACVACLKESSKEALIEDYIPTLWGQINAFKGCLTEANRRLEKAKVEVHRLAQSNIGLLEQNSHLEQRLETACDEHRHIESALREEANVIQRALSLRLFEALVADHSSNECLNETREKAEMLECCLQREHRYVASLERKLKEFGVDDVPFLTEEEWDEVRGKSKIEVAKAASRMPRTDLDPVNLPCERSERDE